jgi:hypothetical protein
MGQLQEITELEQVYHRLNKLMGEMQVLREFVASKLPASHAPKTDGMIDPRTGKHFSSKKSKRENL